MDGSNSAVIIDTISKIISSVGFPIAVVIYLFYYQQNVLDTFRDVMVKNTEVLQRLVSEINEHFHKE